MADTSYPPQNIQPPAPPVNEPSIAARNPAAAAVHSALLAAGASPVEATNLTAISGAEASFHPTTVSPPNRNGSRDFGAFQINDAAHPQMGGAAVARMPLTDQAALALQIARKRGGYGDWVTYNTGAYRKYLPTASALSGSAGSAPPPAPAGAAPAGAAPAQPPPPTTVGGALGWLTAKDAQTGKSPLDDAGKAMGGDQQQQQGPAPDQQLAAQQAAAGLGNARQQEIAARAQQMAAAATQGMGAPISWSSMPPGARGGLQNPPMTTQMWGGLPVPVPGTTLNSTGAGYG